VGRLNLSEVDALLARLGAVDDPEDDWEDDPESGADHASGAAEGYDDGYEPQDAALSGDSSVAQRRDAAVEHTRQKSTTRSPPPLFAAAAGGEGRPSRRRVPTHTHRPSDLPPLSVPPGYKRDRRGTWRYVHDGGAVPGARDVTLATLFPYGRRARVVVPADEIDVFAALAWCASVGERCETVRLIGGRRVHLSAFEVPYQEWEERARVPLGIDAPELAADRLLSVSDVAALLGRVAPSTVTADVARGRLPPPQVRISGRPAWSAPIVLAAVRARRSR
jgi:hypothetical protein